MGLYETYDYYWNEISDERVKDWMFTDNILTMPLILLCYLCVVFVLAPRYMKDRPAYALKNYARLYNVFQVVANYLIVKGLLDAGWFQEIGILCSAYEHKEEVSTKILNLMWWNLVIKIVDLTETVVFVLRKKERQISVLHLYHHFTTVGFMWIAVKYVGDGLVSFLILVNCSVHVVMYTYYFLSTFPEIQKTVGRFKPLITITQMIQLGMFILVIGQSVFVTCPFPQPFLLAIFINVVVNFVLFYNFYKKNYVKPKKT